MKLIPLSLVRRLARPLQPLRLLCGARWLREADVDFCLGLLHPVLRLNRIHALVESRRWVADDMLALTLRSNGNVGGWRAGQHVQLYREQGGVRHGRSYSLTAVDGAGRVELAVRRQPAAAFLACCSIILKWGRSWNWVKPAERCAGQTLTKRCCW